MFSDGSGCGTPQGLFLGPAQFNTQNAICLKTEPFRCRGDGFQTPYVGLSVLHFLSTLMLIFSPAPPFIIPPPLSPPVRPRLHSYSNLHLSHFPSHPLHPPSSSLCSSTTFSRSSPAVAPPTPPRFLSCTAVTLNYFQ